MARLGFIGLGVMGFPMAAHLQKAEHSVSVYNRTVAKAQTWAQQHGGSLAATPREAATGCDAVFVCVGNDADVREVVTGDDGAINGLIPGSVLVDHTTASAALARELYSQCAEKKIGFVDAPVSGGQTGAERGQLSIMAGGRWDTSSLLKRLQQLAGS